MSEKKLLEEEALKEIIGGSDEHSESNGRMDWYCENCGRTWSMTKVSPDECPSCHSKKITIMFRPF